MDFGGMIFIPDVINVREWKTGLEAWVDLTLPCGLEITVLDSKYAEHRDGYEIDSTYFAFVFGS